MIALFWLFLALSVSPFKSKNGLAAENAALRHQLIVLQRRVRGRIQLTNGDRLFLVTLYRWFPSVLKAITIIRPETLVRWHRAGFRRYWRSKSRSLGGRPKAASGLGKAHVRPGDVTWLRSQAGRACSPLMRRDFFSVNITSSGASKRGVP